MADTSSNEQARRLASRLKWNPGSHLKNPGTCPLCTRLRAYCTCEDITGELSPSLINDPINHPPHYTSHPSGVECITIRRHMCSNLGDVLKYIWRNGLKGATDGIEDLEKAAWYLNDEIELRKKASKEGSEGDREA